ncbi:uncharacterized protein BX664DRAFT_260136 [Halteromyces radiatus]|uniref:uncharacterized protein n=1 Tax=Halteromyces radiatus TaxID=101107 RepID=UPI00221F9FDF|nr:uncharacterized protein BX664DRAFT_260136 [Halteromyces radiatus]KAI8093019.1 hypothetical protein BX664DRAFT_260136 [Halteromyces radiatus]
MNKRLEQLAKDREEYEQSRSVQPTSDFVMMGALMVKYDAIQMNGMMENAWYLYLRDYMDDVTGSIWRVLHAGDQDIEMRISSHQVLADIRGSSVQNTQGVMCKPSPTSNDYRPVYLFYCNNDMISRLSEQCLESGKSTVSMNGLESKHETINNDEANGYMMEYEQEHDELDMDPCKYCGIPESIDDINTIFFCDHCNQGVHQLCEQPPIAAFEMDIDPWYCRECCAMKGLPLPTPPPFISSSSSSTLPIPSSSASTITTTMKNPTTNVMGMDTIQPMSSSSSSSISPRRTDTETTTNTKDDTIAGQETVESSRKRQKLDE